MDSDDLGRGIPEPIAEAGRYSPILYAVLSAYLQGRLQWHEAMELAVLELVKQNKALQEANVDLLRTRMAPAIIVQQP